MTDDERAIRELYATWQRATVAGDLDVILGLLADDVLFFTPGGQPFGKAEFAKAHAAVVGRFRIELRSEFGEISVHGDWAHCWCRLWVTMTPTQGGAPMHRSGHTLTILRKLDNGAWRIARDANLLAADATPR